MAGKSLEGFGSAEPTKLSPREFIAMVKGLGVDSPKAEEVIETWFTENLPDKYDTRPESLVQAEEMLADTFASVDMITYAELFYRQAEILALQIHDLEWSEEIEKKRLALPKLQ